MVTPLPVTLDEVRAAARRIAPHIRRTPTLSWTQRLSGFDGERRVTFKLEQLQVGGSFKSRGALSTVLASPSPRPLCTASGGNHGIGVAWAASRVGVPATVFLPLNAPASSLRRLQAMGAETVRGGELWDDSWRLALEHAALSGAIAVHPFEDPLVIAGQGTVALELLEDAPDLDALLIAIGGGGLVAGAGMVAKALRPGLRLYGVEAAGAPTMSEALRAGQVVELAEVRTIATTLAPRAVGPNTLAFAQRLIDTIVLVSDDEIRAAMRRLWDELRLLVEPAGAAAFAALLSGRVPLGDARHVGIVLCGANLDVDTLLG